MSALMSAMPISEQRIIVLGGGIHGASCAYYLTQLGASKVTVIERSSVAAAASGKAGGFLAREWGRGPTVQLHTKSFDLHAQLATELDLKSYRNIKTLSVSPRKGKADVSWLDGKASSSVMEGNPMAK